jgi:hypothetical protein
MAVAANQYGQAVIAGYTYSSDLPVLGEGSRGSLAGNFDGFVTWLRPDAAAGVLSLACSTYYGGESNDTIYAVATNAAGDTFVAGSTISRTGIATGPAFESSYKASTDGFVARFGACGPLVAPSSSEEPKEEPSRKLPEGGGRRLRGALVLPDAIGLRAQTGSL